MMFGIVRRSWVVLGDPIGPFARWRDLLCQLATEATSQGGWPVFFGVGEAAAKICSKLGFAVRRIGDQAILPLDQFAIEKLSPELQEAHRQIASLGCQFEVVASEAVPALIPELLSVSEDWLRGKRTRQRAFPSIALRVDYLGRFPVGVVRSGGRILAFASLVGSAGKAELSIELVRYIANVPTGILDFVLVEAIRVGEGARLSNRQSWLGAAAGSRPSGHGVTLEAVWRSTLPSRRALLGFQRAAPSQGQVCSALGPALCQLPARSRFGPRDPGFGKTGGRQFPGKKLLETPYEVWFASVWTSSQAAGNFTSQPGPSFRRWPVWRRAI